MGCTSTKLVSYCENPATDYNCRGIQETLSSDGSVQVRSSAWRTWYASNQQGHHSDKVLFTFPMLNSKLSRVVLMFSYSAMGVIEREEPRLFLESVSVSGGEVAAQEITLAPATANPQTVQLMMEASNTPMIANAQPGDIIRLKVLLPLGELYLINVYRLNATLFPLVSGVPAARLSFEEFVERRLDMHTFEIQSYRTWYLRHLPALVGFMNTPPLLHCPQAIEVKMEVNVMKDLRVSAPSNLACFTYLFELQMVEGNKSFASIPLLANLPGTTTISFRITNEMRDPRIKRFFQVFRRGYQIQVARDVHHFAGRCRTHLVRVTAFSLKLQSTDNSPFAHVLYHLSKRDALTVLRRRGNHNHSDGDKAFHRSDDPYDNENEGRGHDEGDRDDGVVETEAMSLEVSDKMYRHCSVS